MESHNNQTKHMEHFFIEENILKVTYNFVHPDSNINKEQTQTFFSELKQALIHNPAVKKALVDTRAVTGLRVLTPAERKVEMNFLEEIQFDKIAVVGNSAFVKITTSFYVYITKKPIKYFLNYDQALGWLKND